MGTFSFETKAIFKNYSAQKEYNGEYTQTVELESLGPGDFSSPMYAEIYKTDNINKFVGLGIAAGDTISVSINVSGWAGTGKDGLPMFITRLKIWKYSIVSKAGQAQPVAQQSVPTQAPPVAAPPVAAPSAGLDPRSYPVSQLLEQGGKSYYTDGIQWYVSVNGAWQVSNTAPLANTPPAHPVAPTAPRGSGGPSAGGPGDDLPF